ncbi:hypothetical protein [Burkholderia gladioli]|uniref:hypothetical protein n=1 Tax=Burkholderia gladioli TaxID=28095 RepID=UPI00164132E2|nr:hypothetical protein [Burkholderia gladioli]
MAGTANQISTGIRICLKQVMRDELPTLEVRYGNVNKKNLVRDFRNDFDDFHNQKRRASSVPCRGDSFVIVSIDSIDSENFILKKECCRFCKIRKHLPAASPHERRGTGRPVGKNRMRPNPKCQVRHGMDCAMTNNRGQDRGTRSSCEAKPKPRFSILPISWRMPAANQGARNGRRVGPVMKTVLDAKIFFLRRERSSDKRAIGDRHGIHGIHGIAG